MAANRIVIKASEDTYYDDEEPTIPSMRPQAIADEQAGRMTPLQWLGFLGLVSATLVAIGGLFDSTTVIGLSGVLMVFANLQATVRK